MEESGSEEKSVYGFEIRKDIQSIHVKNEGAHKIGHGLKLDATGHATRSTRLLHPCLVGIIQVPNSIAWMTEHPEIIPAYIREFLEICLIYPWDVDRFNELMW